MTAVLTFSLVLLLAVLLSDLAARSILSTAVLFLAAGMIGAVTGLLPMRPEQPVVRGLAELALVSVLFTDAMRTGARDLLRAWQLPGRALLLGMPLTLIITALLARWVTGISWGAAFLVGAVLSPTDPVFAAAIVGSARVPGRLRDLLNVESGLNDGIAAPIVVVALGWLGSKHFSIGGLLWEIIAGVALGVAVPWIAIRLERMRLFKAHGLYRPMLGLAIAMVVWSLAVVIHVNQFLASFAAGVTVATVSPEAREAFHGVGERLAELLKLAALLVFGALISPQFLKEVGWQGYVFALLALVVARPIALWLALLGSELDWREKITAYWFGPKGFASVVFGLLVLEGKPPDAERLFHLIAVTVTLSIVLHASTDVPVAKWFKKAETESGGPVTIAPPS